MASTTGCSNSPTRITQPSSVAREISTPASRSRIASCRYSGRWSQYFATTVSMITAVAGQSFFHDARRKRRHLDRGTFSARTFFAFA